MGVIISFGLASCATPPGSEPGRPPSTTGQDADEPGSGSGGGRPQRVPARVTRVVDGDTFEVSLRGDILDVRLIGIDTPETVKPGSPVECFGKEASRAATDLLEGRRVRMVKDVSDRDRYDRLVRYVYIGQEMANARLVVNGYASAYTYPPDVRHADLFVRLQRDARDGDRGLWSPDTCSGAA